MNIFSIGNSLKEMENRSERERAGVASGVSKAVSDHTKADRPASEGNDESLTDSIEEEDEPIKERSPVSVSIWVQGSSIFAF